MPLRSSPSDYCVAARTLRHLPTTGAAVPPTLRATATTARFLAFFPPRAASFSPQGRKSPRKSDRQRIFNGGVRVDQCAISQRHDTPGLCHGSSDSGGQRSKLCGPVQWQIRAARFFSRSTIHKR